MEWLNINDREIKDAGQVMVEQDGDSSFTAPFVDPGPAVLYLKEH